MTYKRSKGKRQPRKQRLFANGKHLYGAKAPVKWLRPRRNSKIKPEQHRRLNWSSSIVNKQYRNALHASGKWVAFTDIDGMLYTRKGAALIQEQKNMKEGLERDGYIEVSKVQLDILYHLVSQLRPKPILQLLVYNADEVNANSGNAIVYVHNVSMLNFDIVGSPRRYRIYKYAFETMPLRDVIDSMNNRVASPQWLRLPTVFDN